MEGNLRLKIDWASLTGAVSEAAAITSHFQQNSRPCSLGRPFNPL